MIRIKYSLIAFIAITFCCGTLALAQNQPVQGKAPSLSSATADSGSASSNPALTTKSISKSDRELAKRSYKAGITYRRGGLVRQAMQSLQQAVSYDPEFADAYSALGQAYIDLAHYDDAVVALERAIKLDPNAPGAYTLLGQAHTKLKEKGALSQKTSNLISGAATVPSSQPEPGGAGEAGTDSDPTAVYYVGVSDVLDIQLPSARIPAGASAQSNLHVVASNGYLEHPILGRPIKILGLTTDQISALISGELKRLSIRDQPAPEVSVRDFNSHTILVSGLVKEPGTKILRREAIPLYVVLADAQPLTDAAIVDVMSQRAIKHRTVDLSHPEQTSVLIRPGDVVTVRAAVKQFFYVGGNVKSPGELLFRSGLTLTQAILSAGGVILKGEKVQLTRGQGNGLLALQEFKLKEINSGKIPDPLIEPGDRITVMP